MDHGIDIMGTPKLGFGMMRLPQKGDRTDLPQVEEMVDRFLEAGFTYFDTAFVYGTSEEDTRKALVDRYPRERFTLATKLHATAEMVKDEKDARQEFYTSLKRTGAGYFDYYLLHALMDNNYETYDRYGIWEFAARRKEEGLIRHLGFSFHAGPELLDRLLTDHPEAEFVQLQINYADWEDPEVQARANYEVARKHGRGVVIMEPVKGGALADPPDEVKVLFRACRPELSPASWGIRFAASMEGVITVLSGMSTLAQMEDNLSYMRQFRPLDGEEREVIRRAREIMSRSDAIPCTGCRYCVRGCPRQIPIPELFAAVSLRRSGRREEAKQAWRAAAGEGRGAADCIGCGRCEALCPQHLPIREELKKGAALFEKDGP